ncbi:MAG: hypothetical protein K2M68_05295 [Muribaculaceae bacterium]|nr:hypothetical protein [Muribaculaceae bacterium]
MAKLLKTIIYFVLGSICMSLSCAEEFGYVLQITIVNETDNDVFVSLSESYNGVDANIGKLEPLNANSEIICNTLTEDLSRKIDWYLFIIYPDTMEKYGEDHIRKNKIYDEAIKLHNNRVMGGNRHIYYKGPGQSEPSYRD